MKKELIISLWFQLYPQYYEVIKEPVDLKMIAQKIQTLLYRTLDDIEKDFNTMVKNAKTFNEPKSLIFKVRVRKLTDPGL